jgi:hypothetical protein
MKHIEKKVALKICSFILLLAGIMDIIRGFTHTFRVRYAVEHLAKIESTPDNLVLMSAFGISNILSGLLYFLIVFKAKKLAPYALAIIPLSYLAGGLGMRYSNIVLESEFKGQHMMKVYLGICLITAIFYFILIPIRRKELSNKQ